MPWHLKRHRDPFVCPLYGSQGGSRLIALRKLKQCFRPGAWLKVNFLLLSEERVLGSKGSLPVDYSGDRKCSGIFGSPGVSSAPFLLNYPPIYNRGLSK